jgi:hypothetical protein
MPRRAPTLYLRPIRRRGRRWREFGIPSPSLETAICAAAREQLGFTKTNDSSAASLAKLEYP